MTVNWWGKRGALIALAAAVSLLTTPVYAQQRVYYHLSSGTGFVINRDGHIITNAHVVRNCRSITILEPRGAHPATLVARDEEKDLAVLKSNYISRTLAQLRWNIVDLQTGDAVVMMGFPGTDGANGRSQFKKTQVTSLKGPVGEPDWIQLSSVAAHGNSGGPLLDQSGNVIAIIKGMAMLYKVDAAGNPVGSAVSQSDVAIPLASLKSFLQAHGIGFYEAASDRQGYADSYLGENAREFTVAVRCVQDPVEPR
jgi:S1-C subfamily serine protease